MKNFLSLIIAVLILGSSNAYAYKSHMTEGAIIGGTSLAITGIIVDIGWSMYGGFDCYSEDMNGQQCESGPSVGQKFAVVGIGAAGGAIIGGLIGLAIPKESKIAVAPIYTHSSSEGNTTGGTIEFKF